MGKKIKFAVVGFGHIGKRHATMVQNNPDTELIAVADTDSLLAEVAKEEFNVPFFEDVDKLLESGLEFDVVNICTPNGLHAEQSIKALNKKKHVVCEKPMALTKADCEQIIFKSLQVAKHVFCVKQNRYSPPAVWLRSLIDEERLGEVYMVQINCYWNRDEYYYSQKPWRGTLNLDGGPLFTQFSHFIDIMYWLFGDVKNVKANFKNFSHHNTTAFEDSGFVSFDFVNGGIGSINYSTSVNEKNFESSITIIGEKGTVKVGGQYMDKIEYCEIENYEMPELPPSEPPNNYGKYTGSAANHHFIIQNVVDTLTGKSAATTNALEGLKVVDIIERIYEGRKI